MQDQRGDGLIFRPVESIGRSLDWFRQAASQNGITISRSRTLTQALRCLEDLRNLAMSPNPIYQHETVTVAHDYFAEAYGADLLTKTIHSGVENGLQLPARRWKLLLSGDPILTRRSIHPTGNQMERNLTWETMIAGLVATFATDVTFAEPDIRCRYQGTTFTVAAKVAYSWDKLRELIKKGFDQANEQVDGSLVLVNMVELYPHLPTPPAMTLRWSIGRAFADPIKQLEVIRDSLHRWIDNNVALGTLLKELRPRAGARPIGVAFFVPLLLHVKSQPVPFLATHMPVTWNRDAGADYAFAKKFLHACNGVRGFEGDASVPG